MNIENLKKSLKYTTVPVSIDIGGEKFDFNVNKTVPYQKNEEFTRIVIDGLFRNSQYNAWLLEPAIDFATVAVFTDIDTVSFNRDEIHALMYTTSLLNVIEQNADAVYLYNLRNAARNLAQYYLELSKPRSASEQSMEKLNTMIDTITEVAHLIKEKVEQFDISDDDINKLVEMLSPYLDEEKSIDALKE